jgi:hypothetical protein
VAAYYSVRLGSLAASVGVLCMFQLGTGGLHILCGAGEHAGEREQIRGWGDVRMGGVCILGGLFLEKLGMWTGWCEAEEKVLQG